VRAVNLIPTEERRGGGAPGRTGNAVYVVLGAMGVLLIALTAWVMTGNSIKDKQGELNRLSNEANVAESQAASLRAYSDFATLRQKRIATVAALAESRFDWDRAMRQLARVLPGDVWLTSFVGTVKPGVSFANGGAGGSDTGQIRGALPVPAVELVGCTETQAEVATVMARLRQIEDVTRVTLASSEKSESAAGASSADASGGSGGSGDSDCRHGSTRFPQFSMVVFFRALPGSEGGTSALPATGAPVSAAPATGAQSQAGAPAQGAGAQPAAQSGATGGGK
jgi:Tfp pilus assembly protein PilN